MSATAIADLPRVELGAWPTPLREAPRLSAALGGPRILLKRDDVMPLGLGGNKVRKLEYLLGHALAEGADTVITTGASTSNHARLTAAACRSLGLAPVLLLRSPAGQPPAALQGNLLLDRLFDAEIRFADGDGPFVEERALLDLAEELRRSGRRPYVIPTGGSVGRGAVGYAHAVQEIAAQSQASGRRVDAVIAAAGSGGTHAGLMLGRRLFGLPARVLGVRVAGDGPGPLHERVRGVLEEACRLCGIAPDPAEPVELIDGYLGAGYGDITDGVREALALVARTEGVLLDPVYTGKAMAALIGEIRGGRFAAGQTLVFVHSGGVPGLFTRAGELLAAGT